MEMRTASSFADDCPMDAELVERFLENGFVKIEGAFPPRQLCAVLGDTWRETGYDPEDPGTWKEPVVRVSGMVQGPFAAAVNTPVPHEAFDLLVGEGRWAPRYSLGSFPLRFPHEVEPDDAGRHIEGSYQPQDASWPYTNDGSKGRALLMLLLFSEVTEADAPTHIRVGSHLDVPSLLEPYGETGVSVLDIAERLVTAPRTARSITPPAAPVTSTSAIRFWCTRRSRATAPAPASWPSQR